MTSRAFSYALILMLGTFAAHPGNAAEPAVTGDYAASALHTGEPRDREGIEKRGPVTARNSRSQPITVELRNPQGVTKANLRIAPGQRRQIGVVAEPSWAVIVRWPGEVKRYYLHSIGSFHPGRWYLRIR